MLAALPIASFAASVAWLWLRSAATNHPRSWRRTFISACVLWGVLVTAITEMLSLPGWLSRLTVAIAWFVVLAMLLVRSCVLLVRLPPRLQLRPLNLTSQEFALLVLLGFVIGGTGLEAAFSAPNTWDAMSYHLSRVVHWIQNQSVADYPTHILRQLYLSPWAEFAVLNLDLLGGGDHLANMVQWFSMVGSLVGVTLITEELGGERFAQLLGAVFVATIPMGVFQASSTQNDYVVSFWLVCLAYFVLRIRLADRRSTPDVPLICGVGATLGLALLTKATAYLFAFPFCVLAAAFAYRRRQRGALMSLTMVGAIALILNLGDYQRNLAVFGAPLGPGQEGSDATYANTIFSTQVLISNLVRNISLHLGTPNERVNAALTTFIVRVHSALGLGISDPSTTWPRTTFTVTFPLTSEVAAGNPLHLLLIVFATASFVAAPRRFRSRQTAAYAAAVTFAFLAFCLVLRWQPWNSRLQLPLFVLYSPVAALSISTLVGARRASYLAMVLLLADAPALLLNHSRPYLGSQSVLSQTRTEQYFANRPELEAPYTAGVQFVRDRGCHEVGLLMGDDSWEYPLWVLLDEPAAGNVHLRHINVSNASAALTPPFDVLPCAIISIDTVPARMIQSAGMSYSSAWSSFPVDIYLP